MHVFVAGATGVAGRRAVGALVAAGHEVSAIARSKAALVSERGAKPVEVDLFDRDALVAAVAGHDAVVNLATKIPALNKAMVPGAWRENDRIRSEGSRNLVDAALETGARVYIQESLAFMYPDRGEDWIDEDVPPDPPEYAAATLVAESNAATFTEGGGAGISLRFGQFYSADSSHTQTWVATARKGLSPFLGPPDAYLPFIHADDVASAVVAALDAPAGVYNVVSDPCRQGEAAGALAGAVGKESLRFAPSPVVKLGGAKVRMFMRSQRVSNERFRNATGWSPKFPDPRTGIRAVAEEIVGG